MDNLHITQLIENQRCFFNTGCTRDIGFRIKQLDKLASALRKNESEILDAMAQDLRKHPFESYSTEIGYTLNEIEYMKRHIKNFAKQKKVRTSLFFPGGRSYIIPEPLGVSLIISPWNYPVQLLLSPLAGAIAAGCCAVLKPSELAPNCSGLIAKIISESFGSNYICIVEGNAEETRILLQQKFDHIFFTGGTKVGKIVMEAAAKYLTPVTLELGGKSPCIVHNDTKPEFAARRIAWGKFINAGQTCVAPDYLLVHKDMRQKIIEELIRAIENFYGKDALVSPYYSAIINERHFDRLKNLMKYGNVIYGGSSDITNRLIAPVLTADIDLNSPLWDEEIFGPILPILEYSELDEAIGIINSKPKPLALYFFSNSRSLQKKVLKETSSGGVCINDTIIHITSKNLPFGGVGESGMGNYHGKASFQTFSHMKSVMANTMLFDPKFKYPPYKLSVKTLKRVFRLL